MHGHLHILSEEHLEPGNIALGAIRDKDFIDKFDFMFIDASHSYENCLNDTATAFQFVRQGGIITWHDYNGWPGVTKALNEARHLYPATRFFWIHDTSIVVAMNNKYML